ncbi:hypothetical protein L841_4275 [Mycobacterium sp. MAC_080597_8934]|uniref:Uncharacterized protein n=1 Tax=Mycobacterium avium (strain 104) TaxID=243243 RepID=A0A0H2ZZN9_MYCA1|nr:hypothetical protein MAV_1488 [Mycobacterium avium 104]ETZ55500.1 hypothetical protein L839_0138 [Mycobacterium avium MAV_120809_2495]ETZ57567.1 hypothetical protein L840_3004 [Mycobacterium sp. MAC_011194_8550]ETZ64010.1 hypothetical protein L841_4275 [Mycobacterium sp. MAC_080597_8934]
MSGLRFSTVVGDSGTVVDTGRAGQLRDRSRDRNRPRRNVFPDKYGVLVCTVC